VLRKQRICFTRHWDGNFLLQTRCRISSKYFQRRISRNSFQIGYDTSHPWFEDLNKSFFNIGTQFSSWKFKNMFLNYFKIYLFVNSVWFNMKINFILNYITRVYKMLMKKGFIFSNYLASNQWCKKLAYLGKKLIDNLDYWKHFFLDYHWKEIMFFLTICDQLLWRKTQVK
jgi:hypothetical protein